MAGRSEQKGSQIAEEIAKGKELVDDGVVVGNEMKNAALAGDRGSTAASSGARWELARARTWPGEAARINRFRENLN